MTFPRGVPTLLPGQVASTAILDVMDKLAAKQMHGYDANLGLAVLTEAALGGR